MGCHFLLQGNLPNQGVKPTFPALAGGCFTTVPPGKPERTFIGKDLTVLTGTVVKHPPASAGDVGLIPQVVVATRSGKQTHSEKQCR